MELKLLLLVGTALLATSVIGVLSKSSFLQIYPSHPSIHAGIAPDAQSEVQVLMEVDEVSSVGKITDEEVAALKNRLDAAISHTTVSCLSLYLSCPGPSTGACHNTTCRNC